MAKLGVKKPSQTSSYGQDDSGPKRQSFSLLSRRHVSDPQMSSSAKAQADADPPPLPTGAFPRKGLFRPVACFQPEDTSKTNVVARSSKAPPAYGDHSQSALALPVSRLSESSRSDVSDHIYAQTTVQTTTTTFFRLPRRSKPKTSLFPLPPKTTNSSPKLSTEAASVTSRSSTDSRRNLRASAFPVGPPSRLSGPTRPCRAYSCDDDVRKFAGNNATQQNARGSFAERRSFADRGSSSISRPSAVSLFGLSRWSHASESHLSRTSVGQTSVPGTPRSGSSIPVISVPAREEGDTPAKYLIRLESSVHKGAVAAILSRSHDDFSKNVLRSYMRGFSFFGDPLDMSIRKMLMEAELPKETQQIDSVLQAFANRYHECNPGIFPSPEVAYFIAFSILILHTDVFNKNNRTKMQKHEYVRIAKDQGVAPEILECFYDNITYTPFIHMEDESTSRPILPNISLTKRSLFRKHAGDQTPMDPYSYILSNQLDSLRSPIKDVMDLEDHYDYRPKDLTIATHLPDIARAFFNYGQLQVVSSRSRPNAFTGPETSSLSHPGLVNINVAKVGILWRKDTKKKKTRSPWQEWGAILTNAQLYLFRNHAWVRTLMHQYHLKRDNVIFKPPLQELKPDVTMPMMDAVALRDDTYRKHKNAFLFIRHGALEETILADNESEYHDWLLKLNYAASHQSTRIPLDTPQSTGPASDEQCHARHALSAARNGLIKGKIQELEDRSKSLVTLLQDQIQNARHLQILAPFQDKTREQIVFAAGGMAAKIKWTRIDIWRTRCQADILAQSLNTLNQPPLETAQVSSEDREQSFDAAREVEEMFRSLGTGRSDQRRMLQCAAANRSVSDTHATTVAPMPNQLVRTQSARAAPSPAAEERPPTAISISEPRNSRTDAAQPPLRRSLHRTLRDSTPTKPHRTGDSASSADIDTDYNSVLMRGSGSFTVHGKKASVITMPLGLNKTSP